MEETTKAKIFFRRDPFATIATVVLIFFGSQLMAGLLISLYPALRGWTEDQGIDWMRSAASAQFVYILLVEIFTVFAVFRVLRWIKARPQRIGMVRPAWADIGRALLAYGLYFLAALVVRIIARPLLSGVDFEQEQQIGFETAYSSVGLVMAFISLAVLPPIAEEILFRGFLFSSLRAKYRYWIAAMITSALFCVPHLQFGSNAPLLWVAAIDAFILSLFLCYLRETYKSLWPPIFLHVIKNGIAFMILFGPRFL